MTTSEDDGDDRQTDSETSSSFSLQGSAATAVKHDFSNPCFVIPSVAGCDFAYLGDLPSKPHSHLSEVEMMKERFAKLLLGEDMSGGGRGVCSALAISNAITNLAASVFGELWRLEPLSPQKKKMWCREMGWLLSVNDSIVDLIPSKQEFPGGGTFEVMSTRVRSDLYVNLPALKKLDAMLLTMLEEFKETEFWYVDRESDDRDPLKMALCSAQPSVRQEDKWWLPCPRVPSCGLSEEGRKRLQQRRDCTNQILKAAMAINSSVLEEMEIPCIYLESLPKNGKYCLGDIMYHSITAEQFSAECLLDCIDLSSEHLVLEVANRIEAAIHVWISKDERRHGNHSKSKQSSWSGKVKGLVADNDKNHVLAHRAETLLRTLKLRFPVLPQTVLDMTKIQCNQDVGQAILESYSRVMESLAFNIMARIDDLLFVDDATKQSSSESKPLICRGRLDGLPIQKPMSPSPFSIHHSSRCSSFATPSFCLTPATGSPGRSLSTLSKLDFNSLDNVNSGKFVSEEFARMWLHPDNLSARRAGDAPERD